MHIRLKQQLAADETNLGSAEAETEHPQPLSASCGSRREQGGTQPGRSSAALRSEPRAGAVLAAPQTPSGTPRPAPSPTARPAAPGTAGSGVCHQPLQARTSHLRICFWAAVADLRLSPYPGTAVVLGSAAFWGA